MSRKWELSGIACLVAVSVASWIIVSQKHLVLVYNDSMSHLNIARMVVDNLQPGLAQIGTDWLPMNHLLDILLVWNNWAWHSGFAGSFISMTAYVTAAIGVYLIVLDLTEKKLAAVIGAAAFALNPNVLYLQATPLTEVLFLSLLVWSMLCLVRFMQLDDARYLIGLGAIGFFEVLTRYDGWFVVGILGVVILLQQKMSGRGWSQAFGRAMLVSTPAVFAALLWALWNELFFGNPFYFLYGQGSASAQQNVIAASSALITKHNLALSSWVFLHDMADNIGLQCLALAGFGLGYWIMNKDSLSLTKKWLLFAVLISPIVFNILALFLGFSTITIPELGARDWFNVRYGILALPLVAISIGLFAKWSRQVAVVLAAIILVQAGQLLKDTPITILDGTQGSSSFTEGATAAKLGSMVKPGQHVLMSFSAYSPLAFASGLPLSDYVHEGVARDWSPALKDPQKYAQWIVMANYNIGDPVYLVMTKSPSELQQYHLVYRGQNASIYEENNTELSFNQ